MLIKYAPESFRDFTDSLIPGYSLKLIPHPFQRMRQAIGIMLVKCDIKAFSTGIPLAPGVILIRTSLYDPVIFNLDFQAAINGAQRTARFFP